MTDEKDDVNLNSVVTELLLRISTLEKLLLEKNVFTSKEYSVIFEASVKKVTDLMEKTEAENTTIFVPATINKNKLEN